MEGSFAHAANHYHFKRARWRRPHRQKIQDWIIAAVQNVAQLCGATCAGVAVNQPKRPRQGAAAASRPSLLARASEKGARIVGFPPFSDFPGTMRAA